MSAVVALEVYLGLSLVTFLGLFYKFYKLNEEKEKLLKDASDISYWMIEHNHDISHHFSGNGMRLRTQDEIKSYDYLKIFEKARNHFSGNYNNNLNEDFQFNNVFDDNDDE